MAVKKTNFRRPLVALWFRAKGQIFFSSAVLSLLVAISSYTNSPSFKAWYGPIDDHDFLQISNPRGLFGIGQNIHQYFLETGGLGDLGHTPRYLPVYYFLRFIIISILGGHPGFLYFFRACSQAICAFLVYLICKNSSQGSKFHRYLVEFIAVITSILTLSAPSWIDISTRLGPSEMELSIGICLTIIGLFNLTNTHDNVSKNYDFFFLVLLIGVGIATGSKENGLVSVVALGYILITKKNWIKRRTRRIIFAAMSTIIPSAVAYNVITVISSGSDVYGNQRNSGTIVSAIIERAQNPNFYLILGSATIVALNYLRAKGNSGRGSTVVVVFLAVLYLSEGIFYSNNFVPLRYGLLSDLAVLLSIGITLSDLIGSKLSLAGAPKLMVAIAVVSALFLELYVLTPYANLESHFIQSKNNSNYTNNWKSQILGVGEASILQPTASIVLYEQSSDGDYERIASIVKYMRFIGAKNLVYLIVLEPEDKTNALLSSLWDISISGSKKWGIEPFNKINENKNAICISFSDDPRITGDLSSSISKIGINCSTFSVISS